MLIVGDLHLTTKEPHFTAISKFLDWINDKFENEILILLGDIFDYNPHWDIFLYFKKFLKNRKNNVYILSGNHDFSKSKGVSLKGYYLIDNVYIYLEKTEVNIEGFNCLMLPFQYSGMKETYEQLEGKYDLVFTHTTHPKEAFLPEDGIDLSKISANYFIHGHIHGSRQYDNHIIAGVPIPTRNGEHHQPQILKIEKDKEIEFINVPKFLTYKDINYGESIVEDENFTIYNVKNAPSIQAVYEKYSNTYIREEGIELKIDSENEEYQIILKDNDLKKDFKEFCIEDNSIDKKIENTCLRYLS